MFSFVKMVGKHGFEVFSFSLYPYGSTIFPVICFSTVPYCNASGFIFHILYFQILELSVSISAVIDSVMYHPNIFYSHCLLEKSFLIIFEIRE